MAIQKIFTDDEGTQLTAYRNSQGLCFIGIGNVSKQNIEHGYGFDAVALNSDDLLELINELVYIREQMNNE